MIVSYRTSSFGIAFVFCTVVALAGGGTDGRSPADCPKTPVDPAQVAEDNPVTAATNKGLKLLSRAGRKWQKNKTCFSCHHPPLPMLAMVEAAAAGFPADAAWLNAQADFTHDYFRDRAESMTAGKHVPGGASTVGYGLLSLKLGGRAPDDTTAAMVSNLLQGQGLAWLDTGRVAAKDQAAATARARTDGPWLPTCSRPPLNESRVGATVIALIGLKQYGTKEQRPAIDKATEGAEKWLAKAALRSTEDHFWRLWGLHQLDGDAPAQGRWLGAGKRVGK